MRYRIDAEQAAAFHTLWILFHGDPLKEWEAYLNGLISQALLPEEPESQESHQAGPGEPEADTAVSESTEEEAGPYGI